MPIGIKVLSVCELQEKDGAVIFNKETEVSGEDTTTLILCGKQQVE